MKTFITCMLLALSLTGLNQTLSAQQQHENHAETKNIVIHLRQYTNDLHAVNMALKFGTMTQNAGAHVTLFLDVEGVRLADSRHPQNLTWGHGDSIETLYTAFVKSGGSIRVCPHCAHAVGLEAKDLRQGAVMADEKSLTSMLMEADVILDY
jgi:predicted peroxiredoxin